MCKLLRTSKKRQILQASIFYNLYYLLMEWLDDDEVVIGSEIEDYDKRDEQ